MSANQAYEVEKYLPGHLLFGSDGCGNAFLFNLAGSPAAVIRCPFVPLDLEYADVLGADLVGFIEWIARVPSGFTGPAIPNPSVLGLELHEKHPIALGGDPVDPSNKVLLDQQTHAKASCLFNKIFQVVRAKSAR